jgi:SsrA-binding protein
MERIKNKKALHDYAIQDTLEAGIVLFGGEAKAVKAGKVILQGGFVVIRGNELFLTNVQIALYQPGQGDLYDPQRDRKLLVHRKELSRLTGIMKAQGLTIIPLAMYTRGGLIKVEIGIARGKSRVDKRKDAKTKEAKREINRKLRRKL